MLPGCITYGENLDEAVANVKEAIELYIESLRAHNEPIPTEENTIVQFDNLCLPLRLAPAREGNSKLMITACAS